ncbi:MAG: HIT family protein [Steroidobacteraceae bacterium]
MTAIHRRVERLRRGEAPPLVARLASGWAVMGEVQVREGYCLLLPDPVVPHLNALRPPERAKFLADMTDLGDAILVATGADRVNYAMFGNLEPALHAHLFPRWVSESEAERSLQPWALDWDSAASFEPGRHADLIHRLRATLSGQVRT